MLQVEATVEVVKLLRIYNLIRIDFPNYCLPLDRGETIVFTSYILTKLADFLSLRFFIYRCYSFNHPAVCVVSTEVSTILTSSVMVFGRTMKVYFTVIVTDATVVKNTLEPETPTWLYYFISVFSSYGFFGLYGFMGLVTVLDVKLLNFSGMKPIVNSVVYGVGFSGPDFTTNRSSHITTVVADSQEPVRFRIIFV